MKHLASLLLPSLLFAAAPAGAAPDARPTAGFREEHADIKEHLNHLDQMAGSLATADAAGQRKTARFIVRFLTDHLLAHAKWEEAKLYPVVDREAKSGERRFTSSMLYEHGIIGRAIAELDALAAAETIDAVTFVRKTDRTLGLVAAHFEKEEEVFLPILDATMTREALERELDLGSAHR